MDFLSSIGGYLLPFLVILTILVFVHELGHYWVARRNGVRVEVFSIGFGPEIFGWFDRAGTRWKFSALPLGGYVKFYGEGADMGETVSPAVSPASQSSLSSGRASGPPPAGEDESFAAKTVGQRAAIVSAGPLANFAFAILLLAALFATIGQPFTPAVVGEVQPDSAAAEAGFLPGDRIVSLDGDEIERFEDVQSVVRLNPGKTFAAGIERQGEFLSLTVTPRSMEVEDSFGNRHTIGLLGISRAGRDYVRHDPFTSLWRAARETVAITGATLVAVGQIVAGDRGTEELGGPIRIAQMSGEVAQGGIVPAIWFAAVLSINLGLINLFPVPLLDGGHLLFYGVEAVRGRPLGERTQEVGFRIGLALVLGLMLFVTWNDLVQLQVFDFLRGLVT